SVAYLLTSRICVMTLEGEFSFPLEAVKKLKGFLDADARASPRMMARTSFISVCANPELPKEFKLVCQREDAPIIFNRLSTWQSCKIACSDCSSC
uniref:Guanylate cyclase activator 2B n=1 Tax=Gopherus evgoodei TaxID=1825980 RepID=A0A8C4YKS9_9SAUR